MREDARPSDPEPQLQPQPQRLLATIKSQPITIGDGSSLNFRSAVAVFGGEENFVAFLLRHSDELWDKVKGLSLHCATKDGKHRAPMKLWGGETDAWYKAFIVGRCDWPEANKDQACQSIVLQEGESFSNRGTVEACHDKGISLGTYRLAACVSPVFENKAHPEASGLQNLPQWMEYNLQHGVEHFLVYTLPDSDPRIQSIIAPYVTSGLVTQVLMEPTADLRPNDDSANQLTSNDCLYRMKHHTEWLMPFIDVDEYLNFNPGKVHESSFPAGISALLQAGAGRPSSLVEDRSRLAMGKNTKGAVPAASLLTGVHSISFGRFTFRHPTFPKEELQVSSPFREANLANLCPKYIVQPSLVHVLFNHWPTSWVPSAKNLMMPREQLVGHHYRTLDTVSTSVEDRALQVEASALATRLQERLGSPWPSFMTSLYTQAPSSFINVRPKLDLDIKVAASVPDFVEYVNGLKVPTFIEPPGVRRRGRQLLDGD